MGIKYYLFIYLLSLISLVKAFSYKNFIGKFFKTISYEERNSFNFCSSFFIKNKKMEIYYKQEFYDNTAIYTKIYTLDSVIIKIDRREYFKDNDLSLRLKNIKSQLYLTNKIKIDEILKKNRFKKQKKVYYHLDDTQKIHTEYFFYPYTSLFDEKIKYDQFECIQISYVLKEYINTIPNPRSAVEYQEYSKNLLMLNDTLSLLEIEILSSKEKRIKLINKGDKYIHFIYTSLSNEKKYSFLDNYYYSTYKSISSKESIELTFKEDIIIYYLEREKNIDTELYNNCLHSLPKYIKKIKFYKENE